MLYLLPLERVGAYRGPRYLQWRKNPDGAKALFSLKDFGAESPIALVKTPLTIFAPDVLPVADWGARTRERVRGYLRDAGVESRWVAGAQTLREAWHRLASLTQAMQAGIDNAGEWMRRDVHFGPYTLYAYERDGMETPAPLPVHRLRITQSFPRLQPRTRLSRLVRALLLAPLLPLMALPATDNFASGSDQPLTTYSANWSLNSGNFQARAAGNVSANASAECGAFWNADAFGGNHYAFITRVAVGAEWLGPGTRHAGAGTASYYGFYSNGTGSETFVFKMVSGTWTQLGSAGSVAINTNDILRLESSGTVHTPLVNGALYSSIGAQTDSSLSGGAGGLCGFGLVTLGNLGDNWEAGNLITNNTEPQLIQRRRGFSVYPYGG